MREIMFRGKRLDNGEWVYGSFLQVEHEDGSFTTAIFHKKDAGGDAEVAPSTVGQYTGLKDKNGKRIFEGDIVLGLFHYELAAKGVVKFRDGAFGLRWNRGKAREFSAFTSICNVDYKVIGNIHDNKRLLNNQESGE